VTYLDYLLKIPPEDLATVEVTQDEIIVTFTDGDIHIATAPNELRGNRFRNQMIKKFGAGKVK